MEKTSLAYSKTFQGTFGLYKSLEYLDHLNEEGGITPEQIKSIRKIFLMTLSFISETQKIENHIFRRLVGNMLRDRVVNRHGSLGLKGTIHSVTRNFIVTKFKEFNKSF